MSHSTDPATVAARKAGNAEGGTETTRKLAPILTLDADDLVSLDDVETAQRWVTRQLLTGQMSAKEASARTKVLAALAARIRDVEREERESEAHSRKFPQRND